ncbi:MAG: glycoside hydrolase family 78 protein, partial [Phycisphaerae bacterium]|nr:glycoside hydrolase family 78 protein [Phycisphaerae bacterium]
MNTDPVDAFKTASTTHLRCEYLVNPLAINTAQPRLSWEIQAKDRGVVQTHYRILVASTLENLEEGLGDLWDSGNVESDQTSQIVYAGKPLQPGQQVFWTVRPTLNKTDSSEEVSWWSAPATWRMGLDTSALQAKWIGSPTLPPEPPNARELPARPSPMLRKSFTLDKPVKRAIATVSALGLYELQLNGQQVGDQLLSPEWTNYHQHVQYQTYDVTKLLKAGENGAGAILGDGWYAGRIGISHVVPNGRMRAHYGSWLRFLMQINIEYADGTTGIVVTDDSWKATSNGPIRSSCILDGEVYDARLEMPGWSSAGFNDSAWKPVNVLDQIEVPMVAQPNEPIRVTQELKPISVTEPQPGIFVFDFGQNLSGWCKINVKGSAGTTVRIRHAEMLQKDGMLYRDNLRMESKSGEIGARAEDFYTLRGDANGEVYEPHFTYHGFRYVEVAGLPENEKLAADFIVARHFHSDTPVAGEFECSSELLNKIMSNIVWTHRDNMHSVPTDCPQRDERMGWTGDMLAFAQTSIYNMDMSAFFTKWVRDIREAQAKDGRYPDFAPHPYNPNAQNSSVPAWADCGVFLPWMMYINYGDTRLIEQHFESMQRWVDYVHRYNPELLWKYKRGSNYGDWLNGDSLKLEGFPKGEAEIPKEVFATAFFYKSSEYLGKMAAVIGKKEEAEKYSKLAEGIREAFIKAYIKDDASVEGNTQSAYAIALAFNLMPADKRAAAADRMVERIGAYKNHNSTGFYTTVMLMNELTRAGKSDVAYMLINNRTIPSWGYTIDQGATTIWERWDGYVEGRGFQNPDMNSFCHYAIGSVGEWMYRSILGINGDPEQPGFKHIILRPVPGGGLTWAKGQYHSIR